MDVKLESIDSTMIQFVQDFFSTYDKNRHILHKLFSDDGTLIILGNRFPGHSTIQQALLTMVTTTHHVYSIDVQSLPMSLPVNVSMHHVMCAGNVEFGGDPEIYGFTGVFLILFEKPNILSVLSYNERCQWAKL